MTSFLVKGMVDNAVGEGTKEVEKLKGEFQKVKTLRFRHWTF
jgi:hypothetical protein